ncbi:hypothetical protein BB561_002801 [Smittium simulii]|uniref:Pre-mRNA-splicing factor CWC24 n=1 Tax=Smittium simulii TaxID=133385 RepID=A0A2T9YP31_9FUNG|nr:hypothetical protein BB561_002801 [Smittium simulii]
METPSANVAPKIAFKKFKKSNTLKKSKPSSTSSAFSDSTELQKPQESKDFLQDERWNDSSELITFRDEVSEINSAPIKKAKLVGADSKNIAVEKIYEAQKQADTTIALPDTFDQRLGLRADENRIYKITQQLESSQPKKSNINKPDNNEERTGEYLGASAYRSFAPQLQGEHNAKKKNTTSKFGPMRASQNIRVTSVIDYQPDVCKDYKETGFCGYGDSCKFLHDRGDYKSGWQLEQEWEQQQANGGRIEEENMFKLEESENETSEEELPFACPICRSEFKKPVSTKCNHYFCEPCALKNYSKTTKCFICGASTSGLFKPAIALIKKLKEKNSKKD